MQELMSIEPEKSSLPDSYHELNGKLEIRMELPTFKFQHDMVLLATIQLDLTVPLSLRVSAT